MFFVLIAFNLLYLAFFYYVGLWGLGVIPVFFLLFLFFTSGDIFDNDLVTKKQLKNLVLNNALLILWFIITIGLIGVVKGLRVWSQALYQIIFGALIFNLFLWLSSEIINYDDGKSIFHKTYLFLQLAILVLAGKYIGWESWFSLAYYFIVLNFGVYTFMDFCLSNFIRSIDDRYRNLFFVFLNCLTIFSIFLLGKNNLFLSVILSQIYLLGLYSLIYIIDYKSQNILEKQRENKVSDSHIDAILSGKKIQTVQDSMIDQTYIQANDFFKKMPGWIVFFVSLLNLLLIFFQIYLFASHIGSSKIIYEIYYWFGIVLFFINYILLVKNKFYHQIQRIFNFLIINFGIFLSIISIFGKNIYYIVVIGTSWSFLNTIGIFFAHKITQQIDFLYREDFYFWILANILAVFVNSYFIYQLQMDASLKGSLILLYVGVQFFLGVYNIKHVSNKV